MDPAGLHLTLQLDSNLISKKPKQMKSKSIESKTFGRTTFHQTIDCTDKKNQTNMDETCPDMDVDVPGMERQCQQQQHNQFHALYFRS